MTLSYSRALYPQFFFDQTTENFLRGHGHAFQAWNGQPRVILYDNLESAVPERRGAEILFNPRWVERTAHYHFTARPCQVRPGNQKGRVERAIRYGRDSFRAGRTFTTLAECNRQAWLWRDQVAHPRRWPGEDGHTRRSTCASISTIIPSRRKRPAARSLGWPPAALVRILDGALEMARHLRTYDRHQQVLDPSHREAVLKLKRKAFHATPAGRLEQAVPGSKTLPDLAFAQAEPAGSQTAQWLKLLDEYGPAALRRAIIEALEHNTPRACPVAFLLRRQPRPRRVALDLSHNPQAQSVDIRPHDLETYAALARSEDDDPEQSSAHATPADRFTRAAHAVG